MSQPSPLPSPYEISRIAAALRGRAAAKNPVEAIREAIGLWFVAAYELENTKRLKNLYDGLESYPSGDCADRASAESIKDEEAWVIAQSEGGTKIAFGTSHKDSEAMNWLNKNAKDDRDKFGHFRRFEQAWTKAFGDQARSLRSRCTERILEQFEQKRIEARRNSDAKRQRQKRGKRRTLGKK